MSWIRCRHKGACSVNSVPTAALSRMLLLLGLALVLAPCSDAARPSRAIAVEIGKKSATAGLETDISSAMVMQRLQRRRKLEQGMVQVRDCENVQYTGTIALGTPAQEFEVFFTTGSHLLWVPSADCAVCGSTNTYDSSLSSTYVAVGTPVSLMYEGGAELEGVISEDNLSVGGLSTSVEFGEMMGTSQHGGCNGVSGMMGMGLANDGGQNAFEDLVEAGTVDVPIFSFFMGNIDTDTPTGVLTLGGVNQTHYEGCLEWVAISSEPQELSGPVGGADDFWSVALKDLKVGSESVLNSEAVAVIDTGTSMVEGPHRDVGVLAEKIGAMCVKLDAADNAEEVDCVEQSFEIDLIVMECAADFGDINFFFGGDDFALTAKELLLPLSDFGPDTAHDPFCLFGMLGNDLLNTWILGDSFLRTFYTAYNVHDKTVGLAQATGRRTGDECGADAALSVGGGGEGVDDASSSSGDSSSDTSTDHGGVNHDEDGGSSSDDGESSEEELGVASGSAGDSSGDEAEEEGRRPSVVAVAMAAAVGSLSLCAVALAMALFVRRRLSGGGLYGQVEAGAGGRGGGALEMSDKVGVAPRHGRDMSSPEDEFLQEKPSKTGSGSHFYRSSDASGGGKRVVLSSGRRGEDEEDEEDVELDLGDEVGGTGGQGAVSAGTRLGPFGRLLGGSSGRAGFAALDDADEAGAGGSLGDV